MLDESGEVLEQVMFTNLTIVEDVNTMSVNLVPAIDESYSLVRSHVGGGPGKLAMESEWKLLQLPIGFWRESAYKREVERRGKFVEQMVFTDGLATLSVFIEPVADDSLQGFSSMGAVNAYSYISDGFAITAIGEVPAITVKQIASSMQRTTK
jgi:sigma-E factor negative regulatory protein RseB